MIGDDVAQALPELRAQAESLMVDTVTIVRPGATITDPETGQVSTLGLTVYQGAARWKPATTASLADAVGTAQLVTTPGALHLPVGTYQPEPGDVATCTGCQLDPAQVGRKVRLAARFGGTQVTQYRIAFEEV